MKKISFIILIIAITFNSLSAQSLDGVNIINAKPNKVTKFSGNLANGKYINDLSWAAKSSVACFPATQNSKFRGKHVIHKFEIPPYSEVTVKLIPNNRRANFSLYGYQVGTTNNSIVPNLSSCVSCEADHKWDYKKRGKTQDHTRSIFFNSTNHSYNIFIGVAGADKSTSTGGYSLEISMKTIDKNN